MRHCVQENTAHHAQQMRVSAYARARTLALARAHAHRHITRANLCGDMVCMYVTRARCFSPMLRSCLSIYRIYWFFIWFALRCDGLRTLFFSAGTHARAMRRALCSCLRVPRARATASNSIYSALFFSARARGTMRVPYARDLFLVTCVRLCTLFFTACSCLVCVYRFYL